MPFNDYYQDIFNKVRKHLLKNKAKKWRDFQYHLITYFIPQVIFDWNHQRLYHIASFRNDASYLNNLIIEIMTIEKQIIDISDYQTELFTNNLTNEINNEKIFEYLIIEKKIKN